MTPIKDFNLENYEKIKHPTASREIFVNSIDQNPQEKAFAAKVPIRKVGFAALPPMVLPVATPSIEMVAPAATPAK